jgi:hypothetical protein
MDLELALVRVLELGSDWEPDSDPDSVSALALASDRALELG